MNPLARNLAAKLFNVEGRSILITGATGALGAAAADTLAEAGAKLTLAAGSADELAKLVTGLQARGAAAASIARRAETEEDAEAIANCALTAYGRIDILVVAAGTNEAAPIGSLSVASWERVMDANVRASWLMARAVGRPMIAQGGGTKIVLISSTRGKLGHPAGYTAYCPSKSAIDGLVRALACEWGPHRICVNAIAPTVFRSKLTSWMFTEEGRGKQTREAMLQRIPLGRLGEPEDLMGILLYLSSSASDFCTGQTIYVDGGYTAG
jgi:NAD(P)-dependent dehydrogenase (short-subunit alcohol dehydrogenase family)